MPINYKDYPPNWKEIRARILKRAKNKCEHCGLENGAVGFRIGNDWIYALDYAKAQKDGFGFYVTKFSDPKDHDGRIKIVLTIAHLDHDKENHGVTDDRLAALCQKCHLDYDRPRHVAKRKSNKESSKSIGLFNIKEENNG